MKDDLAKGQKPNFLLDLSFVMCSCAVQPPVGLDKLDSACFDYYRILKVGKENNGVFGHDSPLVTDKDCVPFVNMDNFKGCQADNYVTALLDISNNAYKMMNQCQDDAVQREAYRCRYERIQQCFIDAQSQKDLPKKDRNYQCVLELLDSWFNVDDKVSMSNELENILETKKVQNEIAEKVLKTIEKIKTADMNYHPELGENPVWNRNISNDNKPSNTGTAYEEAIKNIDKYEKEQKIIDQRNQIMKIWESESEALNAMFVTVSDCISKLNTWTAASIISVTQTYKADEDADNDGVYIDDMDKIVTDINAVNREVDNALLKIDGVKAIAEKHGISQNWSELKQSFKEIQQDLSGLVSKVNELRNSIYNCKAVTENSFLVCRCGGIIKVVQNGNWINISKDALLPNIIDLLFCAEQYIYGKQNINLPSDTRYSIIKAFNIVHGALLTLNDAVEEKDKKISGLDYIVDEECEKARKPAAHIEITVRPKQDMLKQAKLINAYANLVSLVPNFIGVGFTLGLSFSSIIESGDILSFNNLYNGEPIINAVYHRLVKGGELLCKAIGKELNMLASIMSLSTIMEGLTYKSYAAFIGGINITISTFCEQYTVEGHYDIFGRREGEYFKQCIPYKSSIFLQSAPEDNRTNINYKIYEDGMFQEGEESDIMY